MADHMTYKEIAKWQADNRIGIKIGKEIDVMAAGSNAIEQGYLWWQVDLLKEIRDLLTDLRSDETHEADALELHRNFLNEEYDEALELSSQHRAELRRIKQEYPWHELPRAVRRRYERCNYSIHDLSRFYQKGELRYREVIHDMDQSLHVLMSIHHVGDFALLEGVGRKTLMKLKNFSNISCSGEIT